MEHELTQLSGWDTRPKGIGVFRVLYAAILLVLVRLALLALGFQKTATVVHRFSGANALVGAPNRAQLWQATYTVALAAAFVPARILCLERSLTLYHVLKRQGVPVGLRLGVQAYPFEAHAWVELEGKPVNETPHFLKDFQPIFGLG